MTAERMRREFWIGIAEGRFAPAAAGYQAKIGASEDVSEGDAIAGTVGFHKNLPVRKGEIVALPVLKRRSRRRCRNVQQRPDRIVSRRKDSGNDRGGRQRAAGNWPGRKQRVTQHRLDFVERDPGFLRGKLREVRVSAGADVLSATRDA